MKTLPPPCPPPNPGGGKACAAPERPLLDKEGVGGGWAGGRFIHNKSFLTARRKELRNNPTPAETKLWSVLQHSNLGGCQFRRQHSVGYYILDFYCPAKKLAVEVDGDSHFTDEGLAYDIERTRFLQALNLRVLRFTNAEVSNSLEAVCASILAELGKS